jgi:hypothetical protein
MDRYARSRKVAIGYTAGTYDRYLSGIQSGDL